MCRVICGELLWNLSGKAGTITLEAGEELAMQVNEGNGGSCEEVADHEIEVVVKDTPLNDVLGCDVFKDGLNAATPVWCVVESDEGVYEELLEHPQVGMVFSTREDDDKFYRKYGKQRGFGVYRDTGNFTTENGKTNKSKRRSYIWRVNMPVSQTCVEDLMGKGLSEDELGLNWTLDLEAYGLGLDEWLSERYYDAMENRANAEKEADANSAMRLRHAVTGFPYKKTFQKEIANTDAVQKGNPNTQCENTAMESCPLVNMTSVAEEPSLILNSDFGDSCVNESSALGLEDISIDLVISSCPEWFAQDVFPFTSGGATMSISGASYVQQQ
uniref:Uncharacterized protein n=1 Tax=Chenopodium quinoa TaxID=63459 RepID=A0A803MYS7_CHEQI